MLLDLVFPNHLQNNHGHLNISLLMEASGFLMEISEQDACLYNHKKIVETALINYLYNLFLINDLTQFYALTTSAFFAIT